jgi:hypothetical protein
VSKYRKRPVVVEAFQMTAEARRDNLNWPYWLNEAWNRGSRGANSVHPIGTLAEDPALRIVTLEGDHRCEINDWIIQGVAGELYPCKPDIFAKTYEPLEGA